MAKRTTRDFLTSNDIGDTPILTHSPYEEVSSLKENDHIPRGNHRTTLYITDLFLPG